VLPFEPFRGNVWRVIEGQYRPSTRKIVDTLSEQQRLEALLEASKPAVPPDCAHLDYQFRSPFRYGRYPGNSRFRRAGHTPGVFYASEAALTAAIESAWGLVKFYRASPETPLPNTTTAHTAIQAEIRAPVAIDLTHPEVAPLGPWTHPTDYDPCCDFADRVRQEGAEAIRYRSVRDPAGRCNIAVLTCRAFAQPRPIALQTWHVFLALDRAVLTNETLRQDHELLIGEQVFRQP
jgi:hypothetical protein